MLKNAKEGIFVGRTHLLPCFLNLEQAMNPHVFVCGVTGSGKTYLMKSLMLRLSIMGDALVVIIDFTGEYRSFIEFVGFKSAALEKLLEEIEMRTSGIVHADLGGIKTESEKVSAADRILARISEEMRNLGKTRNRRVFIILDEAWKLLRNSKPLETILREGRKYRHGLIFSSQLMEDIDMSMLSNAATLFVFRLQNRQGLERLAKNYNMGDGEISRIQNQEVGGCAVVQVNASNKRSLLFVEKVVGITPEMFLRLQAGGLMEIEISRRKFELELGSICNSAQLSNILHRAEETGHIEIAELIKELIESGIDRRRILAALRRMGVRDGDIADAFAFAVSTIAGVPQ